MNGKQAKRLRRLVGLDANAATTYKLKPSRAYFVQSFVIAGAVNWVTVYRKIPKVSIVMAHGPRVNYKVWKRAALDAKRAGVIC